MARRGRLPRRSALPHARTCADVSDPRVDCAGMPWGHRQCPSTAASITEDHLEEGGCCVDRRLIVVSFLCFPARPDVPAARPGPVDVVEPRDGLDVEVVEAGLVGSNAAGPRKAAPLPPAQRLPLHSRPPRGRARPADLAKRCLAQPTNRPADRATSALPNSRPARGRARLTAPAERCVARPTCAARPASVGRRRPTDEIKMCFTTALPLSKIYLNLPSFKIYLNARRAPRSRSFSFWRSTSRWPAGASHRVVVSRPRSRLTTRRPNSLWRPVL